MATIDAPATAGLQETKSIGDIAVWNLVGFLVLFAACFFNLVALDSGKDEIKLDSQVYLKLAIVGCCGLYGALGFLSDFRVRKVALSFPAAWVLVIFLLCLLASLTAIEPTQALASSISILCIYLMTITTIVSVGRPAALKTMFLGAGLFVFGSWVIYVVYPDLGIMEEPVPGGDHVVRMAGLSHPNTLGQFAGICCLLGVVLYFSYQQTHWYLRGLLGLSIAALAMCYSRAAIVATVVALVVAYRTVVYQRANFKWCIGLLVAVTLGLMVASLTVDFGELAGKYMTILSKSGDAEEITSATGRGEIWSKSIQLIRDKPALGYGPTSSKFLLENYSLYTHNLWLNVGLSCGVGGLLISVIMCATRATYLFSHHSPAADGLFVFIILNGIFENIIFSNLCGLPTVCWVLALSWFHLDEVTAR